MLGVREYARADLAAVPGKMHRDRREESVEDSLLHFFELGAGGGEKSTAFAFALGARPLRIWRALANLGNHEVPIRFGDMEPETQEVSEAIRQCEKRLKILERPDFLFLIFK